MTTDYQDNEVTIEEDESAPARYTLLANGMLRFTQYGELYYRPRLEPLGIHLYKINSLQRLEAVDKLLESMLVAESKHRVVGKSVFLLRRSAQAKDMGDSVTANRLAMLLESSSENRDKLD